MLDESDFDDLSVNPPTAAVDLMKQIANERARPQRTYDQWMNILLGRYRTRYLDVTQQCKGINNHDAVEIVMQTIAEARERKLWEDMQAWKDERVNDSTTNAKVQKAIAETLAKAEERARGERERDRQIIDKLVEQADKNHELLCQQTEDNKQFQKKMLESLTAITSALLKITDQSKNPGEEPKDPKE
jgi:hypothetical protein